MPRPPDVIITPITPPGPPVGFALWGDSKTSDYSSGGYAWTAVPRSRRVPYLEYTSRLLSQLELPLALDGSDTDTSIEPALAAIRAWRAPSPTTGAGTIVRIDGPVDTVGITAWVVQSLALDAAIRRPSDGARVQQPLTFTALEYPQDSGSAPVSPAATAAATLPYPFNLLPANLQALASQYTPQLSALAQQFAPNLTHVQEYVASHGADLSRLANAVPQLQVQVQAELAALAATLPTVLTQLPQIVHGHRVGVVKPGDNLETIAQRYLGDYRKWPAIALLNNRRDVNAVSWGESLLLP